MTLFGTDGIRGRANTDQMSADLALVVGRAVALRFGRQPGTGRVLIGTDTRLSSDMLAAAVAAGAVSTGVDVVMAGVVPTPAVAMLTRTSGADAGVVISASHNPYTDNGIKVFDGEGYKLSNRLEAELETLIADGTGSKDRINGRDAGRIHQMTDPVDRYIAFLMQTLPAGADFGGRRVVIDCANGATSGIAPALFERIGFAVTALFTRPDGRNINADCGSEHPAALARAVVETGADMGLAFDGDGDRLVAVDAAGTVLTGDQVMAVLAADLLASGRLKGNRIVTTVMSNIGLDTALNGLGVERHAADVGDRHVLQEMRRSGAVLGGEESGHIILGEHHTTGDGLLAALQLADVVRRSGEPLSKLRRIMSVLPQVMINVTVGQKPDIATVTPVVDAIRSAQRRLGRQGRVLVRYSGTQPMCRVMVEGPTESETREICEAIAEAVRGSIGVG